MSDEENTEVSVAATGGGESNDASAVASSKDAKKRERDDDSSAAEESSADEDEEWIGPMPTEAVQVKKRKGLYLFWRILLIFKYGTFGA